MQKGNGTSTLPKGRRRREGLIPILISSCTVSRKGIKGTVLFDDLAGTRRGREGGGVREERRVLSLIPPKKKKKGGGKKKSEMATTSPYPLLRFLAASQSLP